MFEASRIDEDAVQRCNSHEISTVFLFFFLIFILILFTFSFFSSLFALSFSLFSLFSSSLLPSHFSEEAFVLSGVSAKKVELLPEIINTSLFSPYFEMVFFFFFFLI